MASSGSHGAAKSLRLLLPFTCDSLRIPDALAEDIGAGEALVVGGRAKAVWRVEVGRDDDGAFLGPGWREFAAACGVEPGWLLVLRHRGRGVLTVKVFDDDCCFRDLDAPAPPAVESTMSSNGAFHKAQFISLFPLDSMDKMLIPAKFVQQYIPKEHLNNSMAIVLGPLGKVSRIKIELDQSNVFLSGGWSHFLELHDIAQANALLLRYEGNMVFTVKVFEPDGSQRVPKHEEIRIQQTSTLPLPRVEVQQQAPCAYMLKPKLKRKSSLRRTSSYHIGHPSWIRKQINTNSLKKDLALATAFCDAIGLREPCTITLKTSMDSSESWLVHGVPFKNSSYRLIRGWKNFCLENSLKEGDICTFNVIKTTLWHVVITLFNEKESPKSNKGRSSSDGENKPRGSMAYLNKARTRCSFGIGPPAWIKKEINSSTIANHLNLPLPFCKSIGLHQHCTITLKTSTGSTKSWRAVLRPYQNCCQLAGGWKSFCYENGIKVGDVCTIKIIEITQWLVIIERR